MCSEITSEMVQEYLYGRSMTSRFTANRDHHNLRTLFNFGFGKKWISNNPTEGIDFSQPVEKRLRYVPPKEDVLKVILAAEPEVQDYLWVIVETMDRMGEINNLKWPDVDFKNRHIVLSTRKKKGGHLTPRLIPMTDKLFEILTIDMRSVTNQLTGYFSTGTGTERKVPGQSAPIKDAVKL